MAKNFKRVQREISYRHLGNDIYHAGFLSRLRTLHGRSALWAVQIWEFALPGLEWAPVFGEDLLVVSPHAVREARTKFIRYEGKEQVRSELLIRVASRIKEGKPVPGFLRLWSSQSRGTVSAITIQMTGVSTRLEGNLGSDGAWDQRAREYGTRCPDCGNTRCEASCRGLS